MSESPDKSARHVALRLSLACDLIEVRPATLALRGFLLEQGIASGEVEACELAVAEACNNAIKYVSNGAREKDIEKLVWHNPVEFFSQSKRMKL